MPSSLDMIGVIPQDLGTTRDSNFAQSDDLFLSARMHGKAAKSQDKWRIARTAVLEDQNNITKWNELLDLLDEKWEHGGDDKDSIKAAIAASYTHLLLRFPYISEYWKRYLIMQYKMNGLKDSLEVLEAATKLFPQSVTLWVDYLSALMSQQDIPKEENEKKIRLHFEAASKIVGFNFNADPFWDKYIEFEKNSTTPQLLQLYSRLITIPLYQYAQYYNQFAEISKNYSVLEVVTDPKVLQKYLDQFSKGLPEDLSVLEQHQIIDDYSYTIFGETQRRVNEIWPFESALTYQELSLTHYDDVKKKQEAWVKYLDNEINELQSSTNRNLQFEAVVSLFERALVPNCHDGTMWQKYITFLSDTTDPTTDFEKIKKIYDRAVFLFVPLDQYQIRDNYATFLLQNDKFDICNEFLLDSLRTLSGSTGTRLYAKSSFVHDVKRLIEVWRDNIPAAQITKILEGLISGYFERVDRYKKEAAQPEAEQEKSKLEFKAAYASSLSKLLNDDAICVVVVQYLKLLDSTKETAAIRKFYNKYCHESAFSSSVQFWRFYVDFEIGQRNLINLKQIIDHIKLASALPKIAVDAFIDTYYEVVCANMYTAFGSKDDKILEILMTIDIEKSESLTVNHSARSRLAANNYMIQEMEEQRAVKSNANHYPGYKRDDELMKMVKRQIGHPGVFVDAVPEITNSIMNENVWVSLADEDIKVPPLPLFRNVEKASMPIHYPDE